MKLSPEPQSHKLNLGVPLRVGPFLTRCSLGPSRILSHIAPDGALPPMQAPNAAPDSPKGDELWVLEPF